MTLDGLSPVEYAKESRLEPYDPKSPVPYWHQRMELATICVCNGLTLFLIIYRTIVRRHRIKAFKKEDVWMLVAGIMVVFPHWVSQIMTNIYGSGLHTDNIRDEWLIPAWQWSSGWVGYYIAVSMIKISVCSCLLEILPYTYTVLRRSIYVLCVIIFAIGFAESWLWVFQCQPFLSNFDYTIDSTYCVNVDAARYAWVGISIPIDIMIVAIPFAIIKSMQLERHERTVLHMVFGANLLGTIACVLSIYGIWVNRDDQPFNDLTYTQTPFLMINDVEILMYAIGASATVFSRFFISKAASFATKRTNSLDSSRVSWRTPDCASFSTAGAGAGASLGAHASPLLANHAQESELARLTVPAKAALVAETSHFRRSSEIERGEMSVAGSPVSVVSVWDFGSK